MSSQERNQEHATNWIVMKQDRRQRLYGPFSNAKEHRNSEAKIFANTILGEYFDPIHEDAKPLLENQMVDAVNDLFQMAGYPDFERPFPTLLPDSTPDDIVFTEQKITLNQGFQKDAAVAMKKLAAGEDMDEYRPPKERKATYGDGLRIFYVSVRRIQMELLSKLVTIEMTNNLTGATNRIEDYLKLPVWRFKKYAEQSSFPEPIEEGVEIFTDKTKNIEYAEAKAGEARSTFEKEPKNLGADEVLYEVPSKEEVETGELGNRGLPVYYKLYAVKTARITQTGRVPEWRALF